MKFGFRVLAFSTCATRCEPTCAFPGLAVDRQSISINPNPKRERIERFSSGWNCLGIAVAKMAPQGRRSGAEETATTCVE
jgi:hypothetical protein